MDIVGIWHNAPSHINYVRYDIHDCSIVSNYWVWIVTFVLCGYGTSVLLIYLLLYHISNTWTLMLEKPSYPLTKAIDIWSNRKKLLVTCWWVYSPKHTCTYTYTHRVTMDPSKLDWPSRHICKSARLTLHQVAFPCITTHNNHAWLSMATTIFSCARNHKTSQCISLILWGWCRGESLGFCP